MTITVHRKTIISLINDTIKTSNQLKKNAIDNEIQNTAHEIFNQLNEVAEKLKEQITALANYRHSKFFITRFFLWIADSSQKRKINKEVAKIQEFIKARELTAPAPKVEPKPELQTNTPAVVPPEAPTVPAQEPGLMGAMLNYIPDANTIGQTTANILAPIGQGFTAGYNALATIGANLGEGIANVGAQVTAMASPLLGGTPAATTPADPNAAPAATAPADSNAAPAAQTPADPNAAPANAPTDEPTAPPQNLYPNLTNQQPATV